jgi:hypothetical protein
MARLQHPSRDPYHVFAGQRPDEPAVIYATRHWWFSLRALLVYAVLLLAPAMILVLAAALGLRVPSGGLAFISLAYSLYALAVTAGAFVKWMKLYVDYLVVTPVRIVDVDVDRIFRVRSAEALLPEIVDVRVSTHGFLASKLNHGDITLQTSAEHTNFGQEGVPRAEQIRSKILSLRIEHEKDTQTDALKTAFESIGAEEGGNPVKAPETGIPVRPAEAGGLPAHPVREEDARPEGEPKPPSPERRSGDDRRKDQRRDG